MIIGVGGYVIVTKWQRQADVTALRNMTDEQLSFRVLSDMRAISGGNPGMSEAFKLPSYQEAIRRGGLDRSAPAKKAEVETLSVPSQPQARPPEAAVTPDVERDSEIDSSSKEERERIASLRKQEEEDAATIRKLNESR